LFLKYQFFWTIKFYCLLLSLSLKYGNRTRKVVIVTFKCVETEKRFENGNRTHDIFENGDRTHEKCLEMGIEPMKCFYRLNVTEINENVGNGNCTQDMCMEKRVCIYIFFFFFFLKSIYLVLGGGESQFWSYGKCSLLSWSLFIWTPSIRLNLTAPLYIWEVYCWTIYQRLALCKHVWRRSVFYAAQEKEKFENPV
jgi:hypothetical protein